MTGFFDMIVDFYGSIFGVLSANTFEMYGITVSYGSILFAVLVIAIVMSVMWKGARG